MPRSRRRPIVIALISIGLLLFVLRQPIFRYIGAALVHEDPIVAGADVLVISGDGASREALLWLAKHADAKLLLADKLPPRVVQIGAAKSAAERRREISRAAGISADRIEILIGDSMRMIRPAQNIETWLTAHPQRHVIVFCDQFGSRGLRRSLNRQLAPALASRVSVQPLPDRRYLVHDWWTTRLGLRAVFDAYLGWTRSVLGLRAPEPPTYLSPDQYEAAFLRSLDSAS
jgi:hypothetical protein